MRTLNRPMFRYGGPIKEGVMNGIREPKKNGGSMGPNEGPRRAALVGNDVFPRTGGRENHFVQIPIGVGMGIAAAGRAAMRFAPQIARGAKKGIGAVKNLFGKNKPFQGPVGSSTFSSGVKKGTFTPSKGVRIPASGSYSGVKFTPGSNVPSASGAAMGEGFVTNPVGTYLSNTMSGKLVSGLYKGATSPTAAGLTQKAGKAVWSVAKDPITIASAGFYFYPDGTPKPDEVLDTQGQKPELGLEELLKTSVENGAAKNENILNKADKRKTQVEKYRDIMDIKGMNKNAAYDSLIAASQAVLGEGDIKSSLRDGSLINKIIGSTSKAFDKPAKTKDAIDTLILKGEITKDINATDPSKAADLAYRQAATTKINKELNPTFATLKSAYLKDNKGQPGIDAAANDFSANNGQVFRGNIIPKADFSEILTDIKKNSKGDIDDITIIANWTQETINKSEKNIPDGTYTVGDRIVTIRDKTVIDVG
tara:strand:- start:578 stop:2017 length:1440 start_codon:yes stop_codon:yes gene_type:complete